MTPSNAIIDYDTCFWASPGRNNAGRIKKKYLLSGIYFLIQTKISLWSREMFLRCAFAPPPTLFIRWGARMPKHPYLVLYIENIHLIKFFREGRDRFLPPFGAKGKKFKKKSFYLMFIFCDSILPTFMFKVHHRSDIHFPYLCTLHVIKYYHWSRDKFWDTLLCHTSYLSPLRSKVTELKESSLFAVI